MKQRAGIAYLILAIAGIFVSSTHASNSCDTETLKVARHDFKKLYDQKKYTEAVKVLKTSLDKCSYPVDENYCWAQSDLALGLLKSGHAQECRDRLAPKVVPNVSCPCCGASEDGGKNASAAERAALKNYELCDSELNRDLMQFKTATCPLKLPPRTLSSALIPASHASKGETECLALIGTKYGNEFYLVGNPKLQAKFDENPKLFCNRVVRLTRTSSMSKDILQTPLVVDEQDEVMGDTGYCCKIDRLGVRNEAGKLFVHVSSSQGPSQPCGGSGTARAAGEGIYQLENQNLILKKNLSWATH